MRCYADETIILKQKIVRTKRRKCEAYYKGMP